MIWAEHDSSAAHAHALSSTKAVIEARVKLELERDQQEQLLLSVIPAYIAAEVRWCVVAWCCVVLGVLWHEVLCDVVWCVW